MTTGARTKSRSLLVNAHTEVTYRNVPDQAVGLLDGRHDVLPVLHDGRDTEGRECRCDCDEDGGLGHEHPRAYPGTRHHNDECLRLGS